MIYSSVNGHAEAVALFRSHYAITVEQWRRVHEHRAAERLRARILSAGGVPPRVPPNRIVPQPIWVWK